MSYNEERFERAQQVAKFAEVGFMAQVREIAGALDICPKEDVKAIAEQLILAVEAMETVESEVEYYRKKIKGENE